MPFYRYKLSLINTKSYYQNCLGFFSYTPTKLGCLSTFGKNASYYFLIHAILSLNYCIFS